MSKTLLIVFFIIALQLVLSQKIGTVDECKFNRMKEAFLETGYRIDYDFKASIRSIFEWHNETLSIWTHLFGQLSWIALAIFTYSTVLTDQGERKESLKSEEVVKGTPKIKKIHSPSKWTIHHYLFGGILFTIIASMTSSVIFHTFRSMNESVYSTLSKIDFTCIVVALFGAQFPQLYYAFHGFPKLRKCYMVTGIIFGTAGLVYCAIPGLTAPTFRILRTSVFIGIATLDALATLHALLVVPKSRKLLVSGGIFLSYVFSLSGIVLYGPRIPERWYPKVFDTTLQSHILMHVTTMISQYLLWYHYYVNYKSLKAKEKTN